MKFKNRLIICLLLALTLPAAAEDLVLENVLEAAIDLPRTLFLLKRDPNGQPLEYQNQFMQNWAFLDTGASGILLSKETTDYLNITLDPTATYADIGVGGNEYFDVSEPLYMGTCGLNDPDPNNFSHYLMNPRWRFQVKQTYAGPWPDEPYDLLGMPVMAGKVAVFDSQATNELSYFAAEVLPIEAAAPPVDFNVALRMDKFVTPTSPDNTPPLPVLAYNPVIDRITTTNNSNSYTASWLLDTGATVSLISSRQAIQLGLMDENGNYLESIAFEVTLGGIGGQVYAPGFQLDSMRIPTLNGFDLVYLNPRVAVYDITYLDEDSGQFKTLDGIFGSNFLCASADISGLLPSNIVESPYSKIVMNFAKGHLGFDLNDLYPLPASEPVEWPVSVYDINRDKSVTIGDLQTLTDEWLNTCNSLNWDCSQADLNSDGFIDLKDYHEFISNL